VVWIGIPNLRIPFGEQLQPPSPNPIHSKNQNLLALLAQPAKNFIPSREFVLITDRSPFVQSGRTSETDGNVRDPGNTVRERAKKDERIAI
jgi:hypothetical protein